MDRLEVNGNSDTLSVWSPYNNFVFIPDENGDVYEKD
jgi:hypothetical protein